MPSCRTLLGKPNSSLGKTGKLACTCYLNTCTLYPGLFLKDFGRSALMSSWEELVGIVKKTCFEMFGEEPVQLSIKTKKGSIIDLPLPAQEMRKESPWHSENFRQIVWPGIGNFYLTPKQALIIKALWRVKGVGAGEISGNDLLRVAESDTVRLSDLWKGSPAWRRLILSTRRGLYHLPGDIRTN